MSTYVMTLEVVLFLKARIEFENGRSYRTTESQNGVRFISIMPQYISDIFFLVLKSHGQSPRYIHQDQ